MDRVIPGGVSGALSGLARMVAPTAAGFRVGSVDLGNGSALGAVAEAVYADWYLGVPDRDVPTSPGRPLEPLLRAAHAGATSFEPGWVVLGVAPGGACLIGRDGMRRAVRMGDYVAPGRAAVPVAAGDAVAVSRRIAGVDPATGWWVTRSPAGEPEGPLGRLYLHPDAQTAARVLHAWTARLLGTDLPWALKCPVDAAAYERPDALVTYVPRDRAPAACRLARDLVREVGALLRPDLPPLTAPVGIGASYADDPGDGSSFGQHVSRALAPGVVALARERDDDAAGVQRLLGTLAGAGIDPTEPWRAARRG